MCIFSNTHYFFLKILLNNVIKDETNQFKDYTDSNVSSIIDELKIPLKRWLKSMVIILCHLILIIS